MNVFCRVVGHAFQKGRIEKRREQRPSGTFLIVREFERCKRCGCEDELYTNKGLIAADSSATPADRTDESMNIDTRDSAADGSARSASITPDDRAAPDGRSRGIVDEPGGDLPIEAAESDEPPNECHGGVGVATSGFQAIDADNENVASSDPKYNGGAEILTEAEKSGDNRQRGSSSETGGTTGDQVPKDLQFSNLRSSSANGTNQSEISERRHRCQACGAEVSTDSSPYREGDICRDCRVGYITLVNDPSQTACVERSAEYTPYPPTSR